jgi:hypothetical protein
LLELGDGRRRHHELVLQEAVRAVGPVPLTEHVQRVVEAGEALDLAGVVAALGVPRRAQKAEGQLVRQPVGEHVGQLEQWLGVESQRVRGQLRGVLAQLVEGCQRPAGQGGATQLRLRADRVEPGAGVVVLRLRAVGVDGDGLLQVVGDHPVRDEVRGLGAGHVQHHPQDDPGQPHTADGRPEQAGVRVVAGAARGQGEDPAVRHQQLQGRDVVAERTGAVVVLAVHVAADRTADGDLAGAGQHRDPQAVGQCRAHQLVEAYPGVDVDGGRVRIDVVDPVQRGHVDHDAAGVLRYVTVGTTKATRDDPALEVGG